MFSVVLASLASAAVNPWEAPILDRISYLQNLEKTPKVMGVTWNDCGGSHVTVKSLTPDTMTLGQTTNFVGTGTSDEAVTGGDFTLHLKTNLINHTYKGKIC